MSTRTRLARLKELLTKPDLPEGVLAAEIFREILDHECSRADRGNHAFSLLLYDFRDQTGAVKPFRSLLDQIVHRVRTSDQVGMFDAGRVGIILPETELEGARKVAQDIAISMNSEGLEIHYEIQSYPVSLDRAESGGNGNREVGSARKMSGNSQSLSHSQNFRHAVLAKCQAFIPPCTCSSRLKRLLDIVGSLVALTVVSPLMILVSILIFVVSPGPVIFRQERLGFLRKSFTMYKLRTMHLNCAQLHHQKYIKDLIENNGRLKKLDTRDPRLIPLGGLIRKCFIDELPQLFNVLAGDMSLVGPRPCLPFEAAQFSSWQNRRFCVLPGMTGLWQTRGKEDATFLQMLRYDVAYAHSSTVWLNLRILLSTVPAVMHYTGLLNTRRARQDSVPVPMTTHERNAFIHPYR